MVNEKEMSVEIEWYFEKSAQKAVKALKGNYFDAEYVPDRRQALTKVLEMIPAGGTIGCGDSVTLHQIGFIDWLKEQKEHEVFNPFFIKPFDFTDKDSAGYKTESFRIARKALTADVFCTGTNAITLDGKIVNIDGHGNRVAAMIFGPGRVIIVAGFNKIVKDVDEAIKRIHEWTAPINMKRHAYKHNYEFIAKLPCYVTGRCQNCHSEAKACCITTIIDGWSPIVKSPINHPHFIIIVGESLGI